MRGAVTDHEGLSPRVRGSRNGRLAPRWDWGSIPACAGEPGSKIAREAEVRVYPRVCGGAHAWCPVARSPKGLSPRVRGSLCLVPSGAVTEGSIPACAGEPMPPSCSDEIRRVYPRVCGGA